MAENSSHIGNNHKVASDIFGQICDAPGEKVFDCSSGMNGDEIYCRLMADKILGIDKDAGIFGCFVIFLWDILMNLTVLSCYKFPLKAK